MRIKYDPMDAWMEVFYRTLASALLRRGWIQLEKEI